LWAAFVRTSASRMAAALTWVPSPPSYFLPYLPIWMRRSFPDFIWSLLAELLVIFSLAKPPSLTGVLITHLLCGLVLFTAQLFVAGDQLLKGAALNAVQIAELL